MFSRKASSWGSTEIPPPHCIYFLTLLAQINLSIVGVNLDFWRSLRPSCTTQEFSVPRHVPRAQWEEKLLLFQAFSRNAQLSVDQESSSLGVWAALGWVTFFLPSGRLFMVWGLLLIASGKLSSVLEGENQNCSNFFSGFPPESHLSLWLLFVQCWFLFGFELLTAISSLMKVLSGWKIYPVAGKLVYFFLK